MVIDAELAREATERFIADHARDAKAAAKAKRAAEKAAQSPSAVEHYPPPRTPRIG